MNITIKIVFVVLSTVNKTIFIKYCRNLQKLDLLSLLNKRFICNPLYAFRQNANLFFYFYFYLLSRSFLLQHPFN